MHLLPHFAPQLVLQTLLEYQDNRSLQHEPNAPFLTMLSRRLLLVVEGEQMTPPPGSDAEEAELERELWHGGLCCKQGYKSRVEAPNGTPQLNRGFNLHVPNPKLVSCPLMMKTCYKFLFNVFKTQKNLPFLADVMMQAPLLSQRTEFFEGCKAINADSIDGICTRFPSLLNEAKQEDKFKDLYRFTFQFGLDSEEGQRSLHREIAIALWKLVFTQNKPPILDQWLHFLNENPSGIKGISRDTWNMFLNFTQVIGPDLSNYSEDEAWPSLFDTFVEWELEWRKKEEDTKGMAASQTASLGTDPPT
ncbi:hypothetical protein JRQ81_010207 [Phrynocephalus forsythii]|uniref:DCN1-like protein n=1 Tax=Phrynocephalus forsythii TaxID=171643 RepID=A0A9Q0X870_9SAUR|nr:hypothetical protein JRQ81_010207 [Phrynocephalus forsythii]